MSMKHSSPITKLAVSVLMALTLAPAVQAVDYTYDELHRLTEATYCTNDQAVFNRYDATGNLLQNAI